MKLRSKLIFVTLAVLTALAFISISIDCRHATAQTTSGKQTEKKTTDKAKEKSDTVLVTFVEIGSVKCIPCRMMQPIMKDIEEEFTGQVKIVFHDVWTPEGKYEAAIYYYRVIPTQIFLDKNGKEYFRHEGFFPKDEVVKVIKMKGVR